MPRSRPRLRCEPLEDRTTPAALVNELVAGQAPVPDPLGVAPAPTVPPTLGTPAIHAAPPSTPIPKTAFTVASAPGTPPAVMIYNADGTFFHGFGVMDYFPSDTNIHQQYFAGGVSATLADVTGDGNPDVIVAAGANGGPRVQVFDGVTYREIRSFLAYDAGFRGGVHVAAGDVTGDGVADIVTGAGTGGAPHVKVFDGKTGGVVQSFFAYDPGFLGGVNVAVGERREMISSGDSTRTTFSPGDIVTGAGTGGAPHVKVFDGKTGAVTQSFFAFAPSFRGGVDVTTLPGLSMAIADNFLTGTSTTINSVYPAHLAVSQTSGGSKVSVFHYGDVRTPFQTFDPFDGSIGGARLATLDSGFYGVGDLIVGAGSGSPRVRTYHTGDPAQLAVKLNLTLGDATSRGGANVG